MADRKSLKILALARFKSAKILYDAEDYDAAGYLLGYVVEMALKALICRNLNLTEYPDSGKHHDVFATHSVDLLLLLSGYSNELDLSRNSTFFTNWSILTKNWSPDVRYNLKTYTKNDIEDKIKALEEKPDGFLSWVRRKKW